jgi:predicted ester cyclase
MSGNSLNRRGFLGLAAATAGAGALAGCAPRKVEQNKDLMDRFVRGFNEGDFSMVDEVVDASFVGHHPLMPEDIQGPEGLKGFFAANKDAMPDCCHPTWTLIGDGDKVVLHMPFEGTFENEFAGIPPNGAKIDIWMANVWRVVDGKIVEAWFNIDTLGLMQQMGAVPAG